MYFDKQYNSVWFNCRLIVLTVTFQQYWVEVQKIKMRPSEQIKYHLKGYSLYYLEFYATLAFLGRRQKFRNPLTLSAPSNVTILHAGVIGFITSGQSSK